MLLVQISVDRSGISDGERLLYSRINTRGMESELTLGDIRSGAFYILLAIFIAIALSAMILSLGSKTSPLHLVALFC